MPNQTYTALTIGPIYQTITEAKRSRAKWAASYFFSWFMKKVFKKAIKQNIKVLLPDIGKYKTKYGSGLYADRLYFVGKVKPEINSIVEKVKQKIAKDIEKHTQQTNVLEFLNQYLNIHILEIDLKLDELKGDEFALSKINQKLDQAELQVNMPFEYENNPLQAYFLSRTETRTILAEDAFLENNRHFQSIAEISTRTLERLEKKKPDYKEESCKYKSIVENSFSDEKKPIIYTLLNDKDFNLLPHHKYYAIMYADGDNIGKLLQALNKPNEENIELQEFSKQLFEFGVKTEKTIIDYGGNGIYLGGEDILAFLPLACVGVESDHTKTIFQLITEIDENWKNTVQKVAENYNNEPSTKDNIDIPTLSYGIQIAYHKFPLKEAMEKAHSLMEKAKDKNKHLCKNTIGISFRKHSGQTITAFIEKSKNCSYNEIQNFIGKKCSKIENENKEQNKTVKSTNQHLLSGIMHRLQNATFQILLKQSIKNQTLDAFFKNSFNEKIHIQEKPFMNELKTLLKKTFNDYKDEQAFKIAYLILRLTHFINSKTDTDA